MVMAMWSLGGVARAQGSRCPAGGTEVPAGASLQAYLSAGAQGDAFCLDAGTYLPAKVLRPRSGQRLYGVPGATVIDGLAKTPSLFDSCSLTGSTGRCAPTDPTGVQLYDLTLQNAKTYDVRTGSGWLLDDIVAIGSGQYGIVLRGSGTVVQNSFAEHDGRFGITASFTEGGAILNDVIAYNNSPANPPGNSGATHFTNTRNLQVLDNNVHDNYGRGIWFDIDSADALIQGNTVSNEINYNEGIGFAVGDGIRVEISCRITVQDNVAFANQGPQIPIDGSDGDIVTGNIVTAPAGQPGIRIAPQDQRTTQPANNGNCDSTPKTARDNTVSGNDITLQGTNPSADYDGIQQQNGASDTSGTVFESNTYHVANCATHLWHWWNGSGLVKVGFATTQSVYGQEPGGTCLSP
jgi:Right handed beta helix region